MVDPTTNGADRSRRFRPPSRGSAAPSPSWPTDRAPTDLVRWMLIPGSILVLLGFVRHGPRVGRRRSHGPRDRADPVPHLRRHRRPGARRARRPAARVDVLGRRPPQAPTRGHRRGPSLQARIAELESAPAPPASSPQGPRPREAVKAKPGNDAAAGSCGQPLRSGFVTASSSGSGSSSGAPAMKPPRLNDAERRRRDRYGRRQRHSAAASLPTDLLSSADEDCD